MSLPAAVRRRTLPFLALVVAAWLLWHAYLAWSAAGRIDPGLLPALRGAAPVDVAVVLPFAPEDFHLRLFQGYGVVSGVHGTEVLLNRVLPRDVERIARYYWVRRIAPRP